MSNRAAPKGYEYFETAGARVLARSDAVATLQSLLTHHKTLYDAARQLPGAQPIAGRTTAYAIQIDNHHWIVRHYVRGGAVAPILGDRYARIVSRSFRELEVTAASKQRGVPTADVVAAAEYADGPFLRFDIVLDFIADTKDLAAMIFDQPASVDVVVPAIQKMLRAGLVHADLNLKNILVSPEQAWIIDLDRARLEDGPNRSAALAMRERLMRSLRKFETKTGRRVGESARSALEGAFEI